MLHSLETCHLETLNRIAAREIAIRQFIQDLNRLAYGVLKPVKEQAAGNRTALSKLLVALAAIGLAAQAGNNPLANVTREM